MAVLRVGHGASEGDKLWITILSHWVCRVRIAAKAVGLPEFDQCVRDVLACAINYIAGYLNTLAQRIVTGKLIAVGV